MNKNLYAVALLVVVLAVAGYFLFGRSSQPANPNTCVSKTLSTGASGACVRDAQTMVNNQAFGIDGTKYIKVTGKYDAKTAAAVKVFQANFNLPPTGRLSPADWHDLCQAEDPPANFVTAAKAAGC